jgi:hypothetical protein
MRQIGFFIALSMCACASAVAQEIEPFATFNQSPIIQIHGLPGLGEARVLGAGRSRYRLIADLASNYTADKTAEESVVFDGETQRDVFAFSRGLGGGLEAGIEIPYVRHSGGSLDGFIGDWHDMIGTAKSKNTPDVLDYRYERDGQTRLSLSNSAAGLGDVRLTGAWQWRGDASMAEAVALRALVKLPTGDSDHLLGSGATDAALWLSGHRRLDGGVAWFGGLGMLVMGEGDVLADQQKRAVPFATIGTGARVFSRVGLKLQVDYHGPLYDGSDLDQIGAHTALLHFGGDVFFSRNTRLEWGLSEDIVVTASPDVVFHLALTITP